MPPSLKATAGAIMASNSGAEAVKVVVRCRPMNSKEKEDKRVKTVKVTPKLGQVSIKNPLEPDEDPKTFTFDAVYDWDCRQRDVYDETAHPLIEQVLEGYNGTIFAYGQTGCGKSFTMMGLADPPEMRGIIPNAFVHIFNHISVEQKKEFLIRASYVEIYNEEIRDLLSKNPTNRLELKEDPDKGVYVKDLTAVVVKDYAEIDQVLTLGNKHRTVGATAMNADSSRSHSLFTVVIEMSETLTVEETGETETKIKAGKLNLVDLAGSERQSKTQAEGQRLKEATKINLSLSALGNVIAALASGKKGHIPYRDSKLTRLLQSSLGGNTKTVMCANIGPADYNFDETMSTLRYANRAKNIKNKPKINEDPKDALLRQFQEEIARLQGMLEGGEGGGGGGGGGALDMEQLQKMKAETEKAEAEKQEMMALLEKERREREAIDAQLAALKAKLVGGAAPGDISQTLLDGPTSPNKEEGSLAAPATPAPSAAAAAAADAGATPMSSRQESVAQAQQEVKKAEEQLYVDDEKFASLQEEVDEKTKKLEKLRKRLKSSLKEVQDLQSEFQDERDDFLETIRSAERELKLYTAIAQRHVSPDMLAMYEEQSTWDDDTEEWILPKAPRGMEQAGAAGGKPPKPRKKPTENADMPPSDIGKASPTSAEDAGYAADIMGDGSGSDDEFENYGNGGNYMQATRGSRGSSSAGSGRMNRSGGPSTFNEDEAAGGKYFTDAADQQRQQAGRRVLSDASALKNEMLQNLVLWGEEDVKPFGGHSDSQADADFGPRRAAHRLPMHSGLPPAAVNKPIPNIGGQAGTFADVLADQRAESAVAKDMARFNQQQALGRPKPMSDADELAFVKNLGQQGGGGGGKMTF